LALRQPHWGQRWTKPRNYIRVYKNSTKFNEQRIR
jgi:hypothetical protein